MRSLLLVLLLALVAVVATAQTFIPGHDGLIWQWQHDRTTDAAGNPIPIDWVVAFEVCRASYPVADLTVCPKLGLSDDMLSDPSPLPDGVWAMGVRAVAFEPDNTQHRSTIAWSHVAGVPTPWVVGIPVLIGDPRIPDNLRVLSFN